jgi:hypothetical protein
MYTLFFIKTKLFLVNKINGLGFTYGKEKALQRLLEGFTYGKL